jgi:hypothetical protein
MQEDHSNGSEEPEHFSRFIRLCVAHGVSHLSRPKNFPQNVANEVLSVRMPILRGDQQKRKRLGVVLYLPRSIKEGVEVSFECRFVHSAPQVSL